jgi:hypothetical protein
MKIKSKHINKYMNTTYKEMRKTANNDFMNHTIGSKKKKNNVIIPLTCLKKIRQVTTLLVFQQKYASEK